MTASGQLECCLLSNSPSTLSGQRLCGTHAEIFQVTGPESLWAVTGDMPLGMSDSELDVCVNCILNQAV